MPWRIVQTCPGDSHWGNIERHSPQTVGCIADPEDDGDYRCFVALGDEDVFGGLGIVAVGSLGFGPLADQRVACLENILVVTEHRRQGLGSELLGAALASAWEAHAEHVWWTVEYANTAALSFYRANGATFIAEEDPDADEPEQYYTAVVQNPASARRVRDR